MATWDLRRQIRCWGGRAEPHHPPPYWEDRDTNHYVAFDPARVWRRSAPVGTRYRQRTQAANALRCHLAELGMVAAQGTYVIRRARRKSKRLRHQTKRGRDWFNRLRRSNPTLSAVRRYAMVTAARREPSDSRGSSTVLGAPGG